MLFQDNPQNQRDITSIVLAILGSGAVGSLITLIGVRLQNNANERNLGTQIKAEADEQRVNREMTMRREIYLEGAEALGKMQSHIMAMANPLLSDAERSNIMIGVNESLNKVAVIASLEILTELDVVQAHYGKASLKLSTERMKYTFATNQLKAYEEAQANLTQRLAQVTTELDAANQANDQPKQSALIAEYGRLEADFLRQEEVLKKGREAALKGMLELVREGAEFSMIFDQLSVKLNCLARNELGFPIDQDAYAALMATASERSKELTERMKSEWIGLFGDSAKETPFDANLGGGQ